MKKKMTMPGRTEPEKGGVFEGVMMTKESIIIHLLSQ